jgi:hypothetical protein
MAALAVLVCAQRGRDERKWEGMEARHPYLEKQGKTGHVAASKAHGGHVLGRVFAPQAFPRICGGCQSGRGGYRFWAISGLNLDRGQLAKLFTSVYSTNFI